MLTVRAKPISATLALALAYAVAAAPAVFMPPTLRGLDLAAGRVLACGLVALSVIDVRSFRLPDTLTLPLCGLGILVAHVLQWDAALARLIAAGVGLLSLVLVREAYIRWRGRHGLGLGDAKLFAVAGAWTGLAGLPAVLLCGSLLALTAVGAAAAAGRRVDGKTAIPFGPFLAAGTWLVWLYGSPL
jgi:prepilin signal peptidase PulO-like enzyme (type II secretory pathway)